MFRHIKYVFQTFKCKYILFPTPLFQIDAKGDKNEEEEDEVVKEEDEEEDGLENIAFTSLEESIDGSFSKKVRPRRPSRTRSKQASRKVFPGTDHHTIMTSSEEKSWDEVCKMDGDKKMGFLLKMSRKYLIYVSNCY